MEWTDAEREAVMHMSCVWLDCPGPHDPRHGPDGPRIARKKADRILDALAPYVAAREAERDEWRRECERWRDEAGVDGPFDALVAEVERLRAKVARVEAVLRDISDPNPEADQDWHDDPIGCVADDLRAALADRSEP